MELALQPLKFLYMNIKCIARHVSMLRIMQPAAISHNMSCAKYPQSKNIQKQDPQLILACMFHDTIKILFN